MRRCLTSLLLLATPCWVYAEPVDYLRDVKPILAKHCFACHGTTQQKAKLRVDTARALRQGGRNGPALGGQSKDSLLIQAVLGSDGVTPMPYDKPPLAAADVAKLRDWIDQGAKAPADETPETGLASHWAFIPPVRHPVDPPVVPPFQGGTARVTAPPSQRGTASVVAPTSQGGTASTLVPPSQGGTTGGSHNWIRNPIDHFILAKLQEQKLTPSPEAEPATLIRRLYLDLVGLLPTIQEVDAFVADRSPGAYERLVDRLLASPHYGERWGRHWLDLARYADSNGYSIDAPREIWSYRDWVIHALNRDVPFDQFVIEQMAGDLLPNATTDQIVATGFHRNTQINQEGGIDPEQFRVEAVADRVATTGVVFLGLTLGCARCHDHKYDPITQKEYYQLFAFLNNQDEPTLSLASPELAARRDAIQSQIQLLSEEALTYQKNWLSGLPENERGKIPRNVEVILNLGFEQRDRKQRQTLLNYFKTRDSGMHERLQTLADLEKRLPKFPTTMVLRERAQPRETFVMLGGDFTRTGERVTPGVPAVLHPLSGAARSWKGGELSATRSTLHAPPSTFPKNRLDLARWLVDPANPLTARVTVNRVWQAYFGKGLVETENDFGTQGTPPSHPELLDWLAIEFMDPSWRVERGEPSAQPASSALPSALPSPRHQGWSLKALHKLIVTSATYRQASRHRPELASIDPHNRLLGRQNRLRLEAEIIRDAALSASGLLNPKIGGPSVFPPQPEGVFRFTQVPRDWVASQGADRFRRGLYTFFWRSAPHPALLVFDAPNAAEACTRRVRSNTPLQALTLLNDEAFHELAQGLATRVLGDKAASDAERVRLVFRLCLCREPSPREGERLLAFVQQQTRETAGDEKVAWTAAARVVMNLDEFVTRE